MKFEALLIVNDDPAAEVLSHVLEAFQVQSERCGDADEALQKLDEKRFDAVVVDFDDTPLAGRILRGVRHSSASKNAVTISLLGDRTNVRSAFGSGANFVLYKPLSGDTARASLRAAVALLKRERRRTFRVPVQLPVTLNWPDSPEVEGIMLDLSEDGMDVLSAQPLQGSQSLEVSFSLPDLRQIGLKGQVAWANTNGQAGIQFVDMADEQREIVCSWLTANAPDAPPEDSEPLTQCKLSDLSLGGCYVETESPFPLNTRIDLCLRAAQLEVHVGGVVRVMHPGHGMGIEFASRTQADQEQVENFIHFLTSHSDVMPELLVAPKSINFQTQAASDDTPSEDEPQDLLLQLLRSEPSMSQDEFLAELRRQRRSEAEASMA
jgi:DNA-binding response OmpR family regulator